jgi:hypothetical protein
LLSTSRLTPTLPQVQQTTKPDHKKLNDKLRVASELLMKDKKKGKTYGANMAGPPQVEGMALDGLEVIDLLEPTTKKKPPPSI